MADRIIGSPEVYGHKNREAEQSVNFVACHDGFTLNDLVSYNLDAPQDMVEWQSASPVLSATYRAGPRSTVMLFAQGGTRTSGRVEAHPPAKITAH